MSFIRKVMDTELEQEELPKIEKQEGMEKECKNCLATGWIHLGASGNPGKKQMHHYTTCGICKGQGYSDWMDKLIKPKGALQNG